MTAPTFEATPVQCQLMDTLTDGESRIIGFGGGIRGTKALALDTPVPTPSGWSTMGALTVGDAVFGANGAVTHVLDVAPVILEPVSYRLTFSDGATIDACQDHLWLTYSHAERIALTRRSDAFRTARRATRASRSTGSRGPLVTALLTQRNQECPPVSRPAPTGTVRTTGEIAHSLTTVRGQTNHAVPLAGMIDLPDAPLPINPYVLGIWLGDGTSTTGSITTADQAVQDEVTAFYPLGAIQRQEGNRSWTFRAHGLTVALRALGVLGQKHIPLAYLRASIGQRLALLEGLMDSDGTATASGRIAFVSTCEPLAQSVYELTCSLGYRVAMTQARAMLNGKDCGPVWRLEWKSPRPVFRLARKCAKQRLQARRGWRYIVACDRIPSRPMRCITVSAADGLYLVGRQFIPTHNTWGSLSALITLCRVFPGSRWAVIRKDLQRLRETTLPSFDKLRALAGTFVGPVNQQTWNAVCANGSELLFRGENIDKDPELLRFHGYEVNGFLNEEADELSERTFTKEIERAGTWIIPSGDQPPAYILNTFNPCANWPRRRFYLPWRDQTIKAPYAFIPSTAADNPFISDEQREAWREMPALEYRRFVEGDWEALTGAYYDTLTPDVFLAQPLALASHWTYWGSFDWGYGHWSVFLAWVTDESGIDYLLNAHWMRKMQDDEMARDLIAEARSGEFPERCLRRVYAGHDCWGQPKAHAASGISTADTFATAGIMLEKADIDKVNGGRAVNRQLKNKQVRWVRTPGTARGYDQLSEILPDELDIRKPAKVDADVHGVGGDDFADAFRYGIATRIGPAKVPKELPAKLPDRAWPLKVKDGRLVPPPRAPSTAAELAEWAAERAGKQGRVPHKERLPRRNYR